MTSLFSANDASTDKVVFNNKLLTNQLQKAKRKKRLAIKGKPKSTEKYNIYFLF